MTAPDPFAHGTPVGDYHSWVLPSSPACPDCECCTKALCDQARDRGRPCDWLARGGPDLRDMSRCPCSALPVLRRALAEAAVRDPSNPGNHHDLPDHEQLYSQRNGHLIHAARYALIAGLPTGMVRDPAEPDWPVLVIVLPTGQVTWHMPHLGVHPDPLHYYAVCGLPRLDGIAWDGHDTAEKYGRVRAWLDGQM